jgi:hypothetical protein
VGIVQLIDSTLAVLVTPADKCPVRLAGAAPSATAARPRVTPEVATCCSVTMFGTTVVPTMGFASTSTWLVERKTCGWAA